MLVMFAVGLVLGSAQYFIARMAWDAFIDGETVLAVWLLALSLAFAAVIVVGFIHDFS